MTPELKSAWLEAFALADQMSPELKIACVEKLYRLANAEWEKTKALLHEETK